ncbi:jg18115 [Pararge aegeria aegeria]|uniref:Jg18115 protein n=1 Tax=Pararge aegeria aegeria TaxID=348720 RepID=A0A8S4QMV0_9NEOP|nr:jg18115 [Pararge aegeria aegeria]
MEAIKLNLEFVVGDPRGRFPAPRAGRYEVGESSSKLIAQVDSAFESNSYRRSRVSPRRDRFLISYRCARRPSISGVVDRRLALRPRKRTGYHTAMT